MKSTVVAGVQGRILFVHAFSLNDRGHGGERRSAQIDRLIASVPNVEYTRIAPERYRKTFLNLPALLLGFRLALGSIPFLQWFSRPKDLVLWATILQLAWFLRNNCDPESDLICFEPAYPRFASILKYLSGQGYRVFLFPQNLEALVPGNPAKPHKSLASLTAEFTLLGFGRRVFTISKEEAWLLNCLSLSAQYLAYIPSSEVLSGLRRLRQARRYADPSHRTTVVAIGSATNLPTFQGYQELFKIWSHSDFQAFPLIVAGYGTERLRDFPGIPACVNVLGSVTDSVLDELVLNARCIVLHQESTSGALTRIPELLEAGVPLLVNEAAARNYHHVEGVHVYSNVADLKVLLQSSQTAGQLPAADLASEQNFVRLFEKA